MDIAHSDSTVMCIPRFSGKSGEFPLWLNYVRRTAIANEEILGIISSWLFNILEWQRAIFAGFRPAADGHPEVLAEPFNEPVAPAPEDDHSTVAARNYEKTSRKRAEFSCKLFASLSDEVIATICEAGEEIYDIPVPEIIERLRHYYEHFTLQDITLIRQKLDTNYNKEESINDFLTNHANVHHTLNLIGQPYTENMKIEKAQQALRASEIYDIAIHNFNSLHPHIATTTFRMFSQYIKTFPITTTATSLGFASNATKSSEQSKNKPRTNRKHYCWTHGSGNHSSDRCKFPIEGHQMDATFYNRKNGSNTGCPKHNN